MANSVATSDRDLTREQLIAALRALRPAFASEGVAHMAVIGSRARCDNRPDSDVDLMIEVERGRKFSLLDLIGVKHVVEDGLGLPADIFMQRSLAPDFRVRAERDKVEVF